MDGNPPKKLGNRLLSCLECFRMKITLKSPQGKLPATKPSIPSRFEQVIIQEGKELDGFWTRTTRFADPLNDLPGPGYYQLLNHSSAKPSSIKGSFGASSKKRFFNEDVPLFNPPGPGSYNSVVNTNLSSPSKSPVHHSPSMQEKQNTVTLNSHIKKDKIQTPGPGAYDISASALENSVKDPRHVSATFASNSKRLFDEIIHQSIIQNRKHGRLIERRHTSVPKIKNSDAIFRSTTERTSPGSKKGAELGPGEYLDLNTGGLEIKSRTKPSIMFAATDKLDRFGKPIEKRSKSTFKIPGPGAYLGHESQEREMIKSSVFLSTTTRFETPRNVSPPVSYKADKIGKKSFHLNVHGTWI